VATTSRRRRRFLGTIGAILLNAILVTLIVVRSVFAGTLACEGSPQQRHRIFGRQRVNLQLAISAIMTHE
jgi:hypothetical protein